jgi:regulator of replication initiation timing
MLKKLSSIALALIIFANLPVQAGVMTRMVEVDKEEPVIANDCCPDLEDCEKQNADLKSRIQKLMGELSDVRDENARLRQENSELASKLDQLRKSISKKVVKKKEVVKEVQKPKPVKSARYAKKDDGSCLACHVGNVVAPVFSTPVGAVMGTVRGSVTKGAQYANGASEAMGGSLPAKVVGNLGGGIFGFLTGAVTGLFKGIVNGVRYGFTRPFSPEAFSTAGEFANYDTFDYNQY